MPGPTGFMNLKQINDKQDDALTKLELHGGPHPDLEQEIIDLEEEKNRIVEANYKWHQAQHMLEFACQELSRAMQMWYRLEEMPKLSLEISAHIPPTKQSDVKANPYYQQVEAQEINPLSPPVLDDVAPIPTRAEVFEMMRELTDSHKTDLNNFLHDQGVKQQRINRSLEDKLKVRRERRAQIHLEKMEKKAFK